MDPQAGILPPGSHFQPALRIQYNVTMEDVVEIPSGRYGFLVARDGIPLRDGQTYADPFAAEDADKTINDAAYLLSHEGQKGPQTTVLSPASTGRTISCGVSKPARLPTSRRASLVL